MSTLSSYKARRQNGIEPMSIEAPAQLKQRLRAQAVRDQRSMAATIRVAIEEFLDRHEPEPSRRRKVT